MGMSPKDELNALLRLMSSSEEPLSLRKNDRIAEKSPFYQLLDGWAQRAPKQEKIDALNAVDNLYISQLPIGVRFWLGEQVVKHNLKLSPYLRETLLRSLAYIYQPNREIVELSLKMDKTLNEKTNIFSLEQIPTWAFNDSQIQPIVVEFTCRSIERCSDDTDVANFIGDIEANHIKKIIPLVVPKIGEKGLISLKVLALCELIAAQKSWKSQTQLLDILDSEVICRPQVFRILWDAFRNQKANMVKWLNYATSHWDGRGVQHLIEIMTPALKNQLMEGHIDHDVWKIILTTPQGLSTISGLWEELLVLSPCINSYEADDLFAEPVSHGKKIAQAIGAALDDPHLGVLLPKIPLKSIAVENFFTACEEQWQKSARNRVFDDKKLLQRFKSKDFMALEHVLKRLHPTVYGTLQALKYTVGADEPNTVVVVKNSNKKIASECDFSVCRSRWQNLLIKHNLIKIARAPEKTKVARKI